MVDNTDVDVKSNSFQLWLAFELYASLKMCTDFTALVSGEPGTDPDDDTLIDGSFNLFQVAGEVIRALQSNGVPIPRNRP